MASNTNINTPATDANRDPLTGAPGAHPLGTGVGAVVGGAAAGAATGTFAGPVGTVIGGAIGAVVGGLAGKEVAESIDPTAEDAYWRDNYSDRPYVDSTLGYDEYRPAFGYGVSAYQKHAGRKFEDVEGDLSSGWNRARGKSSLEWAGARGATRDAWNRVSDTAERAMPGDSDRDGK